MKYFNLIKWLTISFINIYAANATLSNLKNFAKYILKLIKSYAILILFSIAYYTSKKILSEPIKKI